MYRGEYIYFRSITSDDIDLIMVWENNQKNWKVSSTTQAYTREQVEQFVNLDQDIFLHEQLRLIVCLNETNEVIGNVDLFDFENVHKRVGVGILIDEDYRNKGYANQCVQLVEEYSKIILGVKNLFCNILTDNEYSIKLFEKNNYIRIGEKKNWHQYNGDWYNEFFYQKEI